MLVFRWLVLLMLLGALLSFLLFAVTGQARYKRYGLIALKWTLIAGLGFFAVLIFERIF